MIELFAIEQTKVVGNLTAQAGVRYSRENPAAYIQSNLVALEHIIKVCRYKRVGDLVYTYRSWVHGVTTTWLLMNSSTATAVGPDQQCNIGKDYLISQYN